MSKGSSGADDDPRLGINLFGSPFRGGPARSINHKFITLMALLYRASVSVTDRSPSLSISPSLGFSALFSCRAVVTPY
jgi:hypothetical protein